jgi:endonuclease/exonuclease/phosphatase family metal-dependent hydrolase
VRIVTYNFLSGGSAKRAAHWELLQRLAPDILLAQECRPAPAHHVRGGALWAKAIGRRWGTGVYLARGEIRRIAVPGFSGWITGGELDRAAWLTRRPLRVFSIHCPHGEHGYVNTMHRILDRLAAIADGADLVLGGDFNIVAGIRSADEPVRMSRAERLVLDRLVERFRLIPCWQTMNPGVPLAQTLRWCGNRALPYHCDGIFVPASWRARLESAAVIEGPEWRPLSDHNPVIAVLSGSSRRTSARAASSSLQLVDGSDHPRLEPLSCVRYSRETASPRSRKSRIVARSRLP